ncbi:hypothetical protein THIOM_003737 [Candidatus Thiomargarita nelsonii]|uniref:Uncharacterized protein n=1 Tax=Candidatus Thiomargarita nelsonii TaxID=1003181 RepID=A0A176RXV9_9GAMM|nr:hypothetical protein THIOM_003737 [Candidatus Thiomargarita nelsonii]
MWLNSPSPSIMFLTRLMIASFGMSDIKVIPIKSSRDGVLPCLLYANLMVLLDFLSATKVFMTPLEWGIQAHRSVLPWAWRLPIANWV